MQFIASLRNSRLSAISTAVGTGGKIKVYTGTPPGAANAPTGTLLGTLTAVVFASPSGGVMTFTATSDPGAVAGGTPGYYRITKSDDTVEIEGPSAVAGVEFNFGQPITAGGLVILSSGTITEGNA